MMSTIKSVVSWLKDDHPEIYIMLSKSTNDSELLLVGLAQLYAEYYHSEMKKLESQGIHTCQ